MRILECRHPRLARKVVGNFKRGSGATHSGRRVESLAAMPIPDEHAGWDRLMKALGECRDEQLEEERKRVEREREEFDRINVPERFETD